ncbi:MAG: hypothetical protein JXR37_02080 [Kiritimatiellae bacterium]|nr:hypothetical protein [Kiritimatiellia bacterium]
MRKLRTILALVILLLALTGCTNVWRKLVSIFRGPPRVVRPVRPAYGNPVADALLATSGVASTNLAGSIFLELNGEWVVILPEGLCVKTADLARGAFDHLLADRTQRLLSETVLTSNEVRAVLLVRPGTAAEAQDSVKAHLARKAVPVSLTVPASDVRTDYEWIDRELGGRAHESLFIDVYDPALTGFPELYLMDRHAIPQPLSGEQAEPQ